MKFQARFILNPLFLVSLGVLLLNDHYLKQEYHNAITGKLSDISGIIVLVLFLSALLKGRYKKFIYTSTTLFFIFWKSSYSQGFIDSWNSLDFYTVQRTVDAGDLFCLLILFPLYNYQPKAFILTNYKRVMLYPICGLTLFSIVATSKASRFRSEWIYISETVTVRSSLAHFLDHLAKDNIRYRRDSVYIWGKDTLDRYFLNNIIINKDTVKTLIIGIHDKRKKLEVYIEKLKLSEYGEYAFDDYKEYQKWIKKYRVETVNYFDKIKEQK